MPKLLQTMNKNAPSAQLKHLLNLQVTTSNPLDPQAIYYYQQLLASLSSHLQKHLPAQSAIPFLNVRIIDTFDILQSTNQELSFHSIIKKLIFLEFYVKWSGFKRLNAAEVTQTLAKEVNKILKIQLVQICKQKSKSFISLNKLTTFIRDFSLSKKPSSKMKIQNSSEKSAVNDLSSRIFQPYCAYLLKVLNQADTYSCILERAAICQSSQFVWKMINWSLTLSKIICNLNKLGRYLDDDYKFVWVFMCYFISQDLSIFYELIREHVEKQSGKWLELLQINKKFYKINRRAQIFPQEKMQELESLKRQIDQLNRIKDDLNYLYLNKRLVQWQSSFRRVDRQVLNLRNVSSQALLDLLQDLRKYRQFSGLFSSDQSAVKPATSHSRTTKSSEKTELRTQEQFFPTSPNIQDQSTPHLSTPIKPLQPQTRRNNVFTQKRNRALGRT